PVSQTVCEGSIVNFITAATGDPAPTVQWQVSKGGVNWANINGANTSTLSFTATMADNDKQYRAVWTNSNGFVYSSSAVLTVKATPVLSSALTPAAVVSGTVFNYTPTSATAGTSFTWSRSVIPGISNPAASGTGNISETLINTTASTIVVTYTYKLQAN